MSDALEPLGPLALRALAAEQRRGDVESAMRERLLARVVASVAVGAAATAVVAGAAAASTAASAGQAGAVGAGTAAGAGAGAGVAASGTAAGLTIKALPWILAAFVAGGGSGAALHAALAPSSPPQPSLDATTRADIPTAPPSTIASPASNIPSMPVGSLPSAASTTPLAARGGASAAPAASGGNDVDLAAERALVDRARTALSRGQSRDALDALDQHASRHPRGRLSEEREALAVDALARAGRIDDARARAARFRTSYPNSVFGAVVDAAIPR